MLALALVLMFGLGVVSTLAYMGRQRWTRLEQVQRRMDELVHHLEADHRLGHLAGEFVEKKVHGE